MKIIYILKMCFFAGLIITAPVMFAGCGEDDNQIETSQQTVTEKRTGVLKSLGGMRVGEGTHLLEHSDGTTTRLKSLIVNLDSEKYSNQTVDIRGIVSKAADGKDIMDVQSIDLSEEITDMQESSEGIMTEYQNAEMGFKITYLDSWKIREETNTITFEAPRQSSDDDMTDIALFKTDTVVVTRYSNPSQKTIEAFLNLPADPNELIIMNYIATKAGADQLDGLKRESADKNEIDVYVSKDTFIYKISFSGTGGINIIINRNMYFSMLATFQFLGQPIETSETTPSPAPEQVLPELPPATEPPAQITQPTVSDSPQISDTTSSSSGTTQTETTTASSYGVVSQYIGQTINSLAPESSDNGNWAVYSLEFVQPNYVYVIYGNGTERRRVLLTYNQSSTGLSTDTVGYFIPGETTSWTRVSGENPVESAEKTVVTLNDSGVEQAAVIKEGYNYFSSSPYNFQAQYPSNWYYAGSRGSGDVLHSYSFSNKPVEEGNQLVSIDIMSGSVPSGSPISVGSSQGVKVTTGGQTAIYIQRTDGTFYKVHGGYENEASIIDIAASIK